MTLINGDYLNQRIKELGFDVKQKHSDLLEMFYNELVEWNKHTNLTRIIDEKDFIDKHFLDSLSCIYALDKSLQEGKIHAIDIGTGAGFPLLPLWLFFPHWKITLVDSVNKKLNFINHFLSKVKESGVDISNVKTVHSRAEDLAQDKKFREKYNLTVSRAVSNLASLTELCVPFIGLHGYFIAMKGFEVEEELADAKKIIELSGGKLMEVKKYDLLDTGLKRSLVTIKKVKRTPAEFPRKAGLPQKEPIK